MRRSLQPDVGRDGARKRSPETAAAILACRPGSPEREMSLPDVFHNWRDCSRAHASWVPIHPDYAGIGGHDDESTTAE